MRRWIRRHGLISWLLLLMLIAFLAPIVGRFASLEQLVSVLAESQWPWALLALGLQVVYWIIHAWMYQASFRTVGVETEFWRLLPVDLAAIFVNTMVPAAIAGGVAVFRADARRQGHSGAGATAGTILANIVYLAAGLPLILGGLIYWARRGRLPFWGVAGAALFAAMLIIVSGILFLAAQQPRLAHRVLTGAQWLINHVAGWLRRPNWLPEDWAALEAAQFRAAAQGIGANPLQLRKALGMGLLLHLTSLAILYLLLLALRQPIEVGVLLTGWGLGLVFSVVNIIPQGIGTVEGVMAAVLSRLGVPGQKAIAATLGFRVLGVWLTLVIGFFALRSWESLLPPVTLRRSTAGPCTMNRHEPAPVAGCAA